VPLCENKTDLAQLLNYAKHTRP